MRRCRAIATPLLTALFAGIAVAYAPLNLTAAHAQFSVSISKTSPAFSLSFSDFVGWVERSETHRQARRMMGFAALYPSYLAGL
jgi:hypothetical protein